MPRPRSLGQGAHGALRDRHAVAIEEGSDAGEKDACHWDGLVGAQVTHQTRPHRRLTWNGVAGKPLWRSLRRRGPNLRASRTAGHPRGRMDTRAPATGYWAKSEGHPVRRMLIILLVLGALAGVIWFA